MISKIVSNAPGRFMKAVICDYEIHKNIYQSNEATYVDHHKIITKNRSTVLQIYSASSPSVCGSTL